MIRPGGERRDWRMIRPGGERRDWRIYETKKNPNQLCWLATHEGR